VAPDTCHPTEQKEITMLATRTHLALSNSIHFIMGILCCLCFSMLTGAVPNPIQEVLEAKRFVLRDEKGKIRAELSATGDGTTRFRLMDERGRQKVSLSTDNQNASGISIYGNNGEARISVGVIDDLMFWGMNDGEQRARCRIFCDPSKNISSLSFFDDKENLRSLTGISNTGNVGMELFDAAGIQQASFQTSTTDDAYVTLGKIHNKRNGVELVANKAGDSSLHIRDRNGAIRVSQGVSVKGDCGLWLVNPDHKTQLGLDVTSDFLATLRVIGKDHNSQISLTSSPNKTAGIEISDSTSRPRLGFGLDPNNVANLYLWDAQGKMLFRALSPKKP
jgi:hypothetical protein